jgi:adenylosuccinate synthase
MDTLAGLDTIRVCVAYENDGGSIATVPESLAELKGYRAVTKSLDGWSESLGESTRYEELPGAVHDFLGFVEDVTETPVELISASPKNRIVRRKLWTG